MPEKHLELHPIQWKINIIVIERKVKVESFGFKFIHYHLIIHMDIFSVRYVSYYNV